jgi:hypothetical protein
MMTRRRKTQQSGNITAHEEPAAISDVAIEFLTAQRKISSAHPGATFRRYLAWSLYSWSASKSNMLSESYSILVSLSDHDNCHIRLAV